MEVAEVEEDDTSLDPLLSGGPVTSNRNVETTVLIKDNQTVVLGGLMGTTDTEVETKVPVLGDLPLLGALFRGKRKTARKSNLLIFLTPHIIDDEDDMLEIMEIKEAQFREFRRRFYGRSKEEKIEELKGLLQYSMNMVDRESVYRGKPNPDSIQLSGKPIAEESAAAIREELDRSGYVREPGAGAGDLPMDKDSASGQPSGSTEDDVEGELAIPVEDIPADEEP